MDTIKIKYQDGSYQYDQNGTKITEWNQKACDWVVLPEYENYTIEYDCDENGITKLPRACKRSELPEGWESKPDFVLQIIYKEHQDDEEKVAVRTWGHLEYTEEEAKKRLINFYREILKGFYSVRFKLYMNGNLIYDNKYK